MAAAVANRSAPAMRVTVAPEPEPPPPEPPPPEPPPPELPPEPPLEPPAPDVGTSSPNVAPCDDSIVIVTIAPDVDEAPMHGSGAATPAAAHAGIRPAALNATTADGSAAPAVPARFIV